MSKYKIPEHLTSEQLKQLRGLMGLNISSCSTCVYLGSESDGGEPEYEISWPTCVRVDRYQYLKSFPFKKEMRCWWPNPWMVKFADIYDGTDGSAELVDEKWDEVMVKMFELKQEQK